MVYKVAYAHAYCTWLFKTFSKSSLESDRSTYYVVLKSINVTKKVIKTYWFGEDTVENTPEMSYTLNMLFIKYSCHILPQR